MENKILRVKELTEKLHKASVAYYQYDNPIYTDKQYDDMYDELEQLEKETGLILTGSPTQKVQGFILPGLEKQKHSKPMLSAAKTKNVDEIKKFTYYKDSYGSFKLDGLTLVVVYEEGKLHTALTRGSGIEGEIVTEQAKRIINLPKEIPFKDRLEIRGECVVSWENFNEINKGLKEPFSHPRNMAAGGIRNLNTDETAARMLEFVAFECVTDIGNDFKIQCLEFLNDLGFSVVPIAASSDIDFIVGCLTPKTCIYPVDGLIFEINSRKESETMGSTSHHENCRMALKWEDETYETTLKEIEWNTTRTGLINPTAIFETVVIDGAEVSRATLHNVSYIEELELGIGDTIEVYKANMIIPKVHDNLTRSGNCILPEICPCCGTKTEIHNENGSKTLHCPNPNCKAKFVSKLEHACSKYALNIDGMSGATAELLVDLGYVKTIDDLYHLEKYKDQLMKVKGLGKKSVEKLLENIEKSRTITMDKFLVALCIPNVGRTASKALSKYYNGDITSFIHHASSEIYYDFTVIPDFGEVTSKAINEFFSKNIQDVSYLYEEMNFITETEQKNSTGIDLQGKTFCITGKLQHYSNRDALVSDIEGNNGKYVSSVTSKTNYLINNDVTSTSGKNAKAQKVGCAIISESDFMQMIGKTI